MRSILLSFLLFSFLRTIRFPATTLYVLNYPDETDEISKKFWKKISLYFYFSGCSSADLYIYLIDKATGLPPQTFNSSDLHAYTKQFQIIDKECGFNLTTSFFDDGYYVREFLENE